MRSLLIVVAWLAIGCSSTSLPREGNGDLGVRPGDGSGGNGGGGSGGGGSVGQNCAPTCSSCKNGPCCGTTCCEHGEWCDPVTNTCRCGQGGACPMDSTCSAGPISDGNCGSGCCRPGAPCPL